MYGDELNLITVIFIPLTKKGTLVANCKYNGQTHYEDLEVIHNKSPTAINFMFLLNIRAGVNSDI